jgi:HEAT repeat protein
MLRAFLLVAIIMISGCAEGPLWRMGQYTPWAQNKWAEEEKIADTLFTKKKNMGEMVDQASRGAVERQQEVAAILADVASRDPVLLLRIHAVNQLGRLTCPAAVDALANAAQDRNSDVRLAAIKAFQALPPDKAIPNLQRMVGSDTDIDVRLAATRALGQFPGERAVPAIALALNDPDPALQLRAAESLQTVTGESFGRNVKAWQNYVASQPNSNAEIGKQSSRVANGEVGLDDFR